MTSTAPVRPDLAIDPRKFGLSYPVRVCLYDTRQRTYLEKRVLQEQEIFSLPDTDHALQLSFKLQTKKLGVWIDAVSMRAIVSDRMSVPGPSSVSVFPGGLRASLRTNVRIAPLIASGRSKVPFAFSTVFDEHGFIPESHRLVMGKRAYAPLNEIESGDENVVEDRVIFADPFSPSYGHFLTEALARLWYAKMHPDLPIVWMAGREISEMQRSIIDLLGITNRQIFISRPTRFAEVIFPFPGLCIGDFFLAGHADFLGVVEPAQIIPKKKLYITRSRLPGSRGRTQQESSIDELMEGFGFMPFAPEEHPLEAQLREVSSSEIIVGVEGSALHTPVLIRGKLENRFVAIGRHRMGTGVFGHIAERKFESYRTINLHKNRGSRISARDAIEVDVGRLGMLLEKTSGFERQSSEFDEHCVWPAIEHKDYLSSVEAFRNVPTGLERMIARALSAIQVRDMRAARAAVSALYDLPS
jgi:hypothetical protein